MPVPSPRSKLLPARGNAADLQANVAALVDGEICYAIDENSYYQKVGSTLVKVASAGSGDGGSYDDTVLAGRVTQNESDIDALETTVQNIQSSGYDDTALSARVTTAESDIDALEATVGGLSNYDDTALAARVTTAEGEIDALETTVAGLSNYDDTALAGRVTVTEGDITSLDGRVGTLETTALTDAPSDGTQYARKDGAWTAVEATGGSSSIVYTFSAVGSSAWLVTGPGLDAAGEQNPDLVFQPGKTYELVNTESTHPLLLRNWSNFDILTVNEGVLEVPDDEAPGITDGTLTYVVPFDAPVRVTYYCTNHEFDMKGVIDMLQPPAAPGSNTLLNLDDVELRSMPDGYSYNEVIAYEAGHSAGTTTLQPGQISVNLSSSGSTGYSILLHPVDKYGYDRTSLITAETAWQGDGQIWTGIDDDRDNYVQGTQTGGVFAESNGNLYFDVDQAFAETLLSYGSNYEYVQILDSRFAVPPSENGEIPAADGDVITYDAGDWKVSKLSSSSTIAGSDDYGLSQVDAVPGTAAGSATNSLNPPNWQLKYSNQVSSDELAAVNNDWNYLPEGSWAIDWNDGDFSRGVIAFSPFDDNGNSLVDHMERMKVDQPDYVNGFLLFRHEIVGAYGFTEFDGYAQANLPGAQPYLLDDGTGTSGQKNAVIIYDADLADTIAYDLSDYNYLGSARYIRIHGDSPIPGQVNPVTDGTTLTYDSTEAKYLATPGGLGGVKVAGYNDAPELSTKLEFTVNQTTNYDPAFFTADPNEDGYAGFPDGSFSYTTWEPDSEDNSAYFPIFNTYLSRTDANGQDVEAWMAKHLYEAQRLRIDVSNDNLDRSCRFNYQIDDGPILEGVMQVSPFSESLPGLDVFDSSGESRLQQDNGYVVAGSPVDVVVLQGVQTVLTLLGLENMENGGEGVRASKLTILPILPERRKFKDGDILRYDAEHDMFVPSNALVITHVFSDNTDSYTTKQPQLLWPAGNDAPGFLGEVRIDTSTSKMAIYTGKPTPGYYGETDAGWMEVELSPLSGGGSEGPPV